MPMMRLLNTRIGATRELLYLRTNTTQRNATERVVSFVNYHKYTLTKYQLVV